MNYRNPQYEAVYDFDPYPGSPAVSYMVASTPRCGSTLFAFLCQQTHSLGFPAEYYASINAEIMGQRLQAKNTGLDAYSKAIMHVRTSSNGVFGFKLHYDQLAMCGFNKQGTLKELFPNLKVIFLHRQDILGQAISYHIAASTNKWVDIEGYQMAAAAQCQYSGPAIAAARQLLLDQYAGWRNFLEKEKLPVLELNYEDLLQDIPSAFSSIAKFLGVQQVVPPSLSKVEIRQQTGHLNRVYRELFLSDKSISSP
jgi:LPS sulfotransferase NodH